MRPRHVTTVTGRRVAAPEIAFQPDDSRVHTSSRRIVVRWSVRSPPARGPAGAVAGIDRVDTYIVGDPAWNTGPSGSDCSRKLGSRFRGVGWIAIAVLVAMGVLNVYFHDWLHWHGVLGSTAFWQTAVGRAFACKLAAVALMIAISAIHDFILGPRAGRAAPGSPVAIAMRKRAALLARVNAIVGIILVAAAVRLARGLSSRRGSVVFPTSASTSLRHSPSWMSQATSAISVLMIS